MVDICMPALGADMEFGRLVAWKVRVGDLVQRGDIVGLVETQKATMELESFVAGTVEALLVEPGTRVTVGEALARLRAATTETAGVAAMGARGATTEASGSAPGGAPERAAAAPVGAPERAGAAPVGAPERAAAEPSRAAGPGAVVEPGGHRVRSSPAARKRARELGVALEALHGTGPHGAILLRDVAPPPAPAAVPAAAAAAAVPAAAPMSAAAAGGIGTLRDAIASSMSRSKREIPHYYLSHTISMKRALAWLAEANAHVPIQERVLPGAVLLRAVVSALDDIPELNGFWRDGAFVASEAIHLGTAIALRTGGLIAPAILDADDKPVAELMRALRDLVSRARGGRLRSSELTSATITVTSLGDRGCEAAWPIIQPPQVAIVGFGAILERPWVEAGAVVPHPTVVATLAADHRVSDGHRGGLFLAALDRRLQEPGAL